MSDSSPAAYRPRPPFADWPTQYRIPNDVGRLWYVGRGTLALELRRVRGDLTMAKDYVSAIRALRTMHQDEILAAGGIGLVADFRSLGVVEKDAREYLNAASRRDFRPDDQRFNKVAIREGLVLIRIALVLHGAARTRAGLARVESIDDLEAEVARLGITPPALGEDHPERVRRYEELAASLRDP